jgi:hypothetical protein
MVSCGSDRRAVQCSSPSAWNTFSPARTATFTRFSAGACGRAAPLIVVAMLTPLFGGPTLSPAHLLACYAIKWRARPETSAHQSAEPPHAVVQFEWRSQPAVTPDHPVGMRSTPAAIRSSRSVMRSARLSCNKRTVARPMSVSGSISAPFSRKWSVQRSRLG